MPPVKRKKESAFAKLFSKGKKSDYESQRRTPARTPAKTSAKNSSPSTAVDILTEIRDLVESFPKKTFRTTNIQAEDVYTAQIAVTTSRERLIGVNKKRNTITFKNAGAATVFIGDQNVSSINGFQLLINENITLDKVTGEFFAITNAGTATVHILEQ